VWFRNRSAAAVVSFASAGDVVIGHPRGAAAAVVVGDEGVVDLVVNCVWGCRSSYRKLFFFSFAQHFLPGGERRHVTGIDGPLPADLGPIGPRPSGTRLEVATDLDIRD
jgi:hypothetical protein